MTRTDAAIQPLYLKVKNHILTNIDSGKWTACSRVPSENEIVKEFGISRMTANRALRELQKEGVLVRIAGVGSFVSNTRPHTHPLEIHDIADEIRERGNVHRAELVALHKVRAAANLARDFGVAPGAPLFFSSIVHRESGVPILLENRHVLPSVAPDYLDLNFEKVTPFEYLVEAAPPKAAEHVLRAVMPDAGTRKLLAMKRGEPCLLMVRRTWTVGTIASVAFLYYPGSRYEISGRFHPRIAVKRSS